MVRERVVLMPDELFEVLPQTMPRENTSLWDKIPVGIALVDPEHTIRWANQQLRSWCNGQELQGKDFYQVLGSPLVLGPSYSPCFEALSFRKPANTLLKLRPSLFLSLCVVPLEPDESREGEALLMTLRDVTQECEYRDRLERIHRAGLNFMETPLDHLVEMNDAEWLECLKNWISVHLADVLPFDVVEIRLLDRKTEELRPLLAVGMSQTAVSRVLYARPTDNGITGYVASTGQSYICYDTSKDPLYLEGAAGARSSLTVPIMLHNEVIGTFNVERFSVNAFDQDDKLFLEMYCRELARALYTFDLLKAQKLAAGQMTVEDIHRSIALPVDELFSGLVELRQSVAAQDTELAERLAHFQEEASKLRKLVFEIGQQLQPVEVQLHPAEWTPSAIRFRHILVAVQDEALRLHCHHLLDRHGALTDTVRTGRGSLAMLERENYDAFVVQLHLQDMEAHEVIEAAIERYQYPPSRIFVISDYGYDPHHNIPKAVQSGVDRRNIFLKDYIDRDLVPKLEAAFRSSRQLTSNP